MFPRRPDFTGQDPGAAWFYLSGASAYPFDHSDEPGPLIIQTRMGDILYRLQERTEPLNRVAIRPEWRVLNDHVLAAAERLLLYFLIDATPIRQVRNTHRMTREALQQLVWLAMSTAGTPNDVQFRSDVLVTPYAMNVLQNTEPTYLLSDGPFRATWLRMSDTGQIEMASSAYRPLTGERAEGPSLLAVFAGIAILGTLVLGD